MTRRLIWFIALLAGLVAGFSSGYKSSADLIKAATALRAGTVPTDLGQYAYMEYLHADRGSARGALTYFADLLAEIETFAPAQFRERDLSVAYVRLALLEEASSHPEQAHADMDQARRWFAAGAGGNAMSDEDMKAQIRSLDQGDSH